MIFLVNYVKWHHCRLSEALNNTVYTCMVPRETVSFLFPRVLMFVSGNIRTLGKTKLTSFPRDNALSVLLYI